MSPPAALATQLQDLTEREYVRFVAQWIDAATEDDIHQAPEPTGDTVIDALVAGAAAFVGIRRHGGEPSWTSEPERIYRGLWHPGPPGFFAWSLVHSPASFRVRGILIEEDSLVSV
ncbi:hypothetical protein [Gordonia malaquae]|uniref:hypothetical protein n=1 Tax=Gordonia malaquae TaxID=410332 RepID=UPI00301AE7DD